MEEWIKIVMGSLGVLILASFMPWTAYSFFTSRLARKKKEYEKMLTLLGYTGSKRPAYLPSLDNEYQHRDYFLPVAFATVIVTLCAIVLIFGPRIYHHPDLSFILNGPSLAFSKEITDVDKDKLFGALIVSFAFMGSYIWAIQYLYRRLATVDLTPSAYYGVGIRIIFSIFVALMIYYLSADANIATYAYVENSNSFDPGAPKMLALYAFFAGMFPQRALQYLQDKVRFMKTNSKMRAEPLPLEMIEGIGLFERTRFLEVGIDNAQNLAKSNFVEIIIRTPFSPREIIDWIGQARLYLYFKGGIKPLRNAGVRTIFNLKTLGKDKKNLQKVSTLSKDVPLDKLEIVCKEIEDDPDICELQRALYTLVVGNHGHNQT